MIDAAAPTVSVVIATRNDARRVGMSISSVLEQSLQDFEIVVVNDGSTDETAMVLGKFSAADPRVMVLTNPMCLGRAKARNVGIERARADLVAILDSDDVMLAGRLARQVEFMQRHPSVGVLGSWAIYDVKGRLLLAEAGTDDAGIRKTLRTGENPLINASAMFRRELMLSIGGYQSFRNRPIVINEDYYTWLCLLGKTEFAILTEPLIVVSADSLVDPERTRGKLLDKARLERSIFWDGPSLTRLVRLLVRELMILLPNQLLGLLYDLRFRRWQVFSSPQDIESWRERLAKKSREVEGSAVTS